MLEFEITSNRPDCLSVYGIAREVSAVLDTDLAPWPGTEPAREGEGTVDDYVSVRVDEPELCRRWAGRVFTDVKVAESPAWLKARLTAAGMRSISNVVDITNYVMLCLGEPTHAFDLDKVAGRQIIVRRAGDGERVTTLDGQDRTLTAQMLVIADAEKPSAIAGLMGSEWSEVGDQTTTVLLEAANFDAYATQQASIDLGLRTEGSGRWEKGLDPHLPPRALTLASQLMVELCGARVVPGDIDVSADLPAPPLVQLRPERLEQVIGVPYSQEQIERSLGRLGYVAEDGRWRVPTWRAGDTFREVDLVEEVARVVGVEALPAVLPPHAAAIGTLGAEERHRRKLVEILTGAGLTESVTMAFWDDQMPDRLRLGGDHPARRLVRVLNPMSAEQTLLRTLVFPGVVNSVARNLNGGAESVELFELARVAYAADAPIPDQPVRLGGVLAGPGVDFADVRGVVETLYAALGRELQVERSDQPFLHPGRAAQDAAGFFGELHPLVREAFGIEVPVAVFEFDVSALGDRAEHIAMFHDVTSFPPVRQDIAVIVGDDVPAGEVVALAREAGAPLLADARVFDVYQGAQVGEGRVSLALHLEFHAPDRTLTDAEADEARDAIVAALRDRFGAELRS